MNKKQIKITSEKINLGKVESFLTKIFDLFEINKDLFYKVLICVNEAVINSIVHGNKNETGKIILIQTFCTKNFLCFRITDEGEGFNYKNLPDPTTKSNLHCETGRGLFIIKSISEEINFRKNGKIIEFKIKINGNG